MSDGKDVPQRQGLFRRGVSAVGAGAKGALGFESWKQAGQLAGSAYSASKLKVCPRCREKSFVVQGNQHFCVREDICGFVAHSQEEVENMRAETSSVDMRVLAIAKGFKGSFEKRGAGAKRISWICWGVTACILSYGISWAFDERWAYSLWVSLVAMYTGLNAIKYAFMARKLNSNIKIAPLAFLMSPGLWFVI